MDEVPDWYMEWECLECGEKGNPTDSWLSTKEKQVTRGSNRD